MPRLMEVLSFLIMWFGPGLIVTAIAIGLVHNKKWQFNKYWRWIIMSITAAVALPTPLWSAFATMYVFDGVLHWRIIWAVIIGCGVLIFCIIWMFAMLIGLLARLEGVRNPKDILLNKGLAARLYRRFTETPVGGASICRLSWSASGAMTDWFSNMYLGVISWPFRKLGRLLFGRMIEKRKQAKFQRGAAQAEFHPVSVAVYPTLVEWIGSYLEDIVFGFVIPAGLFLANVFRFLARPFSRNWSDYCPTIHLDS